MIDFSNITAKDILAIIGVATIILTFLELLFRLVPQFGRLRVKFWAYVASKWKHKRLEKRAIASDIENVVNGIVAELQTELPAGWISKASIESVNRMGG